MGSVEKMISANWLRDTTRSMALLFAALMLALGAQSAIAAPADEAAPAEAAAETEAAPEYTYMGKEDFKGQPTPYSDDALKSMTFQDQYNANGEYALWMHDAILLPVITIISLFVLGLLLFVMVRFRRGANPEPSKTTHNTLIEVVWTVIPIIILLVIAVPSITLLAKQYESPPEDAITVKATGYQWYWTYTYPDNGGFEVISNMLYEESEVDEGERFRTEDDGPNQLAVDNRMVVPVGVPLRIQTTAADVIHAFALPSLWFKNDAVPGRINEKILTIDEPGVYFGQCSELCGARHGYMPIAVEAVPMDRYRAWVASKGGTFGDPAEEAPADEAATTEDATTEDGSDAAAAE